MSHSSSKAPSTRPIIESTGTRVLLNKGRGVEACELTILRAVQPAEARFVVRLECAD